MKKMKVDLSKIDQCKRGLTTSGKKVELLEKLRKNIVNFLILQKQGKQESTEGALKVPMPVKRKESLISLKKYSDNFVHDECTTMTLQPSKINRMTTKSKSNLKIKGSKRIKFDMKNNQ